MNLRALLLLCGDLFFFLWVFMFVSSFSGESKPGFLGTLSNCCVCVCDCVHSRDGCFCLSL